MPYQAMSSDTAGASLATRTAILATVVPEQGLIEDQPAFTMTHLSVDVYLEFQQEAERDLAENTNLVLCLVRGDVSLQQLQDIMDGSVWDATPAAGTARLPAVQNSQGNLVRAIKGEVEFVVHELSAASFGGLMRYRFDGKPLRFGEGKYTFPANVGWKFLWYNQGHATTTTSVISGGDIRSWGIWL